jgi:hypothetical protein
MRHSGVESGSAALDGAGTEIAAVSIAFAHGVILFAFCLKFSWESIRSHNDCAHHLQGFFLGWIQAAPFRPLASGDWRSFNSILARQLF